MSNKHFMSANADWSPDFYSHLAINKSRLKEFKTNIAVERKVYLNDGTEFQIELFNPLNYTLGAKIKINGTSISDALLVLYPGQRVWLERDFTSDNKFKFIVYEVEKNNPIVEKAIQENGKIEIEYYAQEYKSGYSISTFSPYSDITWYNYEINSATSARPRTNLYNSECNTACYYNSLETSYTPLLFDSCDYGASSACASNTRELKTKETGRVGRSENHSKQHFEDVNNIDFCKYYFRKEIIQIFPISEKYLAGDDLTPRKYCSNCGKKLKQSFKYCPVCGTKIE